MKNVHKDIRCAYEKNLADYKDDWSRTFSTTTPSSCSPMASKRRSDSVSSRFEHFHEWKRLAEDEPGVVDMETLLKGVCDKRNFMDLFENFIVFDDSSGKTVKIIARNHQFLGVNRAIEAVRNRKIRQGKLGVFLAHPGRGQELLDGLLHPQSPPQAGRQLHLSHLHRPRRPRHPDLQDLRRLRTCRQR